MAEIFLSYANEDREAARKIALLLETAGWSVWWDRRVPAGETWRSVLENALRDMRCMVVLWSTSSVDSHWVKEEAEEARAADKLVPVLIEPVKPPVGFRAIQAADLIGWNGANDAPGAAQLIADLEARLGKPIRGSAAASTGTIEKSDTVIGRHAVSGNAASTRAPNREAAETGSRRLLAKSRLAAVAGSVMILILAWRLWPLQQETPPPQPTIAGPAAPGLPKAPDLLSLRITSERQEIKTEETLSLGLKGRYADGTQNDISAPVDWVSSDPKIATIDVRGRIKAHRPGSTQITARYAELSSPPWTLNVRGAAAGAKPQAPVNLTGIAVGSDKRELRIKERTRLRAVGRYSDGSKKELLRGIVWQSSDATIASINSAGELEALRPGKVEVRATTGAVESSAFRVVVKEAPRKVPVEPPAPARAEAVRVSAPKPPVDTVKIASYLTRAKDYRGQGNYAAALVELEKARSVDPASSDVVKEIEITKRACAAEKKLGRTGLDC